MNSHPIKFTREELEHFTEAVRAKLADTKHFNETDWQASLETYLLNQVWKKLDLAVGKLHRAYKHSGSMNLDQIQLDLLVALVKPEQEEAWGFYRKIHPLISHKLVERNEERKLLSNPNQTL